MPQLAQGAAWFGQLAMVEPHVHGSTFMMLRILVWLTSAAAFKVVDVGAPRSGTQSLKLALQMLGYKPLHSGLDHWSRPAWCQYKFGHGSFEAALEIPLALGYDAAMDEPFQLLYREFMAAFPDSKFIYTVRDPETWFASYDKLISESNAKDAADARRLRGLKMRHIPLGAMDPDRPEGKQRRALEQVMSDCSQCHYWGCNFGQPDTQDSKQQCIQSYWGHLRNVTEAIPKDRLLIFNMSDGWAPLCKFLGKPIPLLPFPHVDMVSDYFSPWDSSGSSTSLVQTSAAWKLPLQEL
ncbi:unnamed protein product [Durusdinium trenchii]|uniref:Sulfotransferase n=1 Tax=Durusdinium trenchii TaxID=1381693 RepID=A0ABP0LAS3_9DINO